MWSAGRPLLNGQALRTKAMETQKEQYAVLLESGLQALYGVSSRANANDICQEVLRINNAVREMAERHLNPLQPLVSFPSVMQSLQDSSNQGIS